MIVEIENKIEVYIPLLEEGTPTIRATDGIVLSEGVVQIMPTIDYDPEDEIWKFLPGSIVRVRKTKDYRGDEIWLAYEQVK